MGGIGSILHGPLYGMTVILRKGFDTGDAADDIGKYGVMGVSPVPTMLARTLDSRRTLSDSPHVVLLGGALVPGELIERCRNYSVSAHPIYDMTETASQTTTTTPWEVFDDVGTVGRPLYFADLRVVDKDRTPAEPGMSGKLVVSGPTVSPGYYWNPEATVDAFSDAGFRTGNIDYRGSDGLLYVLNRKDDRVITGGENVGPGGAAAVLRNHLDVDDTTVLGAPGAEQGGRVAALIVPAGSENPPDDEDLDAFCRERLAGFEYPRLATTVDKLSRTASGTVDREAARERLVMAKPIAEVGPEHTTGYDDINDDVGGDGNNGGESNGSETDSDEATPASDTDEAAIDDTEGSATVVDVGHDGDEAGGNSEVSVDGAERDDTERAEGDANSGDADTGDVDGGDDGDELAPDRDE